MRICLWLAVVLLLALGTDAAGPLKVCMVSGSFEYESDVSLGLYKKHLEQCYNATCTIVSAKGWENLPGLEALNDCDVALFFTRRLRIDGEQLEKVEQYCASGKPIVGVRTASHGFQNWLAMDKKVFGGNYKGHYGKGSSYRVEPCAPARRHPVLRGVPRIKSPHTLYKNPSLPKDVTVLMRGYLPDHIEPVAWVREHEGGRVFYTSLGGQQDFQNDAFKRLLANALFWAAGRETERRDPPPLPPMPAPPESSMTLHLRNRVKSGDGWKVSEEELALPVAKTAILICDMWDRHWCSGATERCGELAVKMTPLVNEARNKGVLIIHAPSETLGFYADAPQRRRIEQTERVTPPKPLDLPDPPLPIDDSDGGCDTDDTHYSAWTRQHPAIEIGAFDVISDDGGEVYSFLTRRGIDTILFMGVHTNMCVLNRTFGIKQMRRWGMNCVLVRDLTDSMYDPKDPPHVSHDEGTQLVVQYIEQHWCPSTTSEAVFAALDGVK